MHPPQSKEMQFLTPINAAANTGEKIIISLKTGKMKHANKLVSSQFG